MKIIYFALCTLTFIACQKVEETQKVDTVKVTNNVTVHDTVLVKNEVNVNDELVSWTVKQNYILVSDNTCNCKYYYKGIDKNKASVVIIDNDGLTKYSVTANCYENYITYSSKITFIDNVNQNLTTTYKEPDLVATTNPRRKFVFNQLCGND